MTASAAALGISDPTLREWMTQSIGTALRSLVVKPRPALDGGAAPAQGLTLVGVAPSWLRLGGQMTAQDWKHNGEYSLVRQASEHSLSST